MRVNLETKDRIALVRGIFSRVALKYDLLNHVFSLGRDGFWRKAAAGRVKIFQTHRVLDLACGTGDQALALAKARPAARVVGVDFTFPMLERARDKVGKKDLAGRVRLTAADALCLPFPDGSFDSLTMAFGIRNIPDHETALAEMLRVLVPGGRVLILELTFPRWSFIRRLYHSYLYRCIPRLGGLVSGQTLAYRYLADSIMDFPSPEEFRGKMVRAGFVNTGWLKLTLGVAALHWGEKPLEVVKSGPVML
ncbi:MAG: class I SAM-dependent methyltransferase [Thermodesulfobacteriota bacterium]